MSIQLNPQITKEQFDSISSYVINDIINQKYDFDTLKHMLSEEWIERINSVWEDQMEYLTN
jgi:hypothetical protein